MARALGARAVPERIAPIAALIPDLARWSSGDCVRLLTVLRTKEGRRERPFVFALLRAERFRKFATSFHLAPKT